MFRNSPRGWRLESSKKVYSNRLIKVYEDTLDLNGFKKIYTRLVRRNFSTIVPFVSDDKILTIKSYRHLVDSRQIEVPSGYIEDGESAEQAACRELEEETGFRAGRLVPVGSYTVDYSMIEQEGNIFAAYDLKPGRKSHGRMEVIETEVITIAQLRRLLLEGKVLNAASLVALYKALDWHDKNRL